MRARILISAAIAAVAVILLVKFSSPRTDEAVVVPPSEEPLATNAVAPEVAPHATTRVTTVTQSHTITSVPITAVQMIESAPVPWPDRIDGILQAAGPETEKADQFLKMLPTLPMEGQEAAAQHMVNLMSDEQIPQVGPLINSTNTPETVVTILMNDLLNRSDRIKLPMLWELAQVPGHPLSEEARAIMGIYLEQDHGNDWDKWREGIAEYLKKAAEGVDNNPVEPTPDPGTPPTPAPTP